LRRLDDRGDGRMARELSRSQALRDQLELNLVGSAADSAEATVPPDLRERSLLGVSTTAQDLHCFVGRTPGDPVQDVLRLGSLGGGDAADLRGGEPFGHERASAGDVAGELSESMRDDLSIAQWRAIGLLARVGECKRDLEA